jgi:hypothetical protein
MFHSARSSLLGAAWLTLAATLVCVAVPNSVSAQPATMPEFPEAGPELWINSKPLALKDLRGQVVLIEVWDST